MRGHKLPLGGSGSQSELGSRTSFETSLPTLGPRCAPHHKYTGTHETVHAMAHSPAAGGRAVRAAASLFLSSSSASELTYVRTVPLLPLLPPTTPATPTTPTTPAIGRVLLVYSLINYFCHRIPGSRPGTASRVFVAHSFFLLFSHFRCLSFFLCASCLKAVVRVEVPGSRPGTASRVFVRHCFSFCSPIFGLSFFLAFFLSASCLLL